MTNKEAAERIEDIIQLLSPLTMLREDDHLAALAIAKQGLLEDEKPDYAEYYVTVFREDGHADNVLVKNLFPMEEE